MGVIATTVQPQPATAKSVDEEKPKFVLYLGGELFLGVVTEIVCAESSPDNYLVCFSPSLRAARELIKRGVLRTIVIDRTIRTDVEKFTQAVSKLDPEIQVYPLDPNDITQIHALLGEGL